VSDVPVADLVLRSAKVATFAARQPTADPFECAEDDLCDLRSDLTVVGGRLTHARGDFEGLRSRLAAAT
jgi:predicted amidohydrolase YtcJ